MYDLWSGNPYAVALLRYRTSRSGLSSIVRRHLVVAAATAVFDERSLREATRGILNAESVERLVREADAYAGGRRA